MQVRIYYCIIIHFLSIQSITQIIAVLLLPGAKILGEEALTYHVLVRHVLNTYETD